MPYPLPDDINAVTDLKWFLVAVPDDPAYTRAAMDVYTGLAQFWQWGKEGPVPVESDLAAQQWADAIYATIEVLKMGFPDLLLGYIDGVETLLAEIRDKGCCGDLPPSVEDTVALDDDGLPDSTVDIPGEDYPDGETTEAGALNALCAMANHVASVMPLLIDRFEPIFKTTSDVIAIATLLILLVLLSSYGVAIGILATGAGLVTIGTVLSFFDEIRELRDTIRTGSHTAAAAATKTELEENYDLIRNTIACADTPDQATTDLWAVFDTEITNSLYRAVLKITHNKGIMRLLFKQAGTWGSETDCDCTPPVGQPTVCIGEYDGGDTYDTALVGGCWILQLDWGEPVDITVTQGTQPTTCGGVNFYRIYSGGSACTLGTLVYSSNTPPSGVTGRHLYVANGLHIVFDVTWT